MKFPEFLKKFPDFINIPLAEWTDEAMDWLLTHFSNFFDYISAIFLMLLLYIERFFMWLPWWALIGIVFIASWRLLGWLYAFILAGMLFLIGSFGYWDDAMRTLALVTGAVILSLAIGVPTGIAASRSNRFEAIIKPLLDAMQTMRSFVYLIPALMFFGIGEVPGVIATVIFAMPPAIRLTCLGMQQIPEELIEAGKAFGCNTWQMLWKIELPSAFPSIMMGVNQTIMMALSMVVIAALIGAGGLGAAVMRSLATVDVGLGFESGLGIVVLAMLLDRVVRPD